jgi:hypothetical protein
MSTYYNGGAQKPKLVNSPLKTVISMHCARELVFTDNPTRKFLTNRIAAFFKFGPIKLIYSEKTPSRVKKQPAE